MSKEQNQILGISWLKFFCFWRPWIAFVLTALSIMSLIGYEDFEKIYLSSIWGILLLGTMLVDSILLVILFFMARKRDSRTINFIGWILLFEIISYAYGGSIQQSQSMEDFIWLFIIMIVIDYFIWYRTNMKYFNKRTYWFNNYFLYENNGVADNADSERKINIEVKTEKNKLVKHVKYCKLCGGKLDDNNKCKKCGKKYLKLNKSLILYLIISVLVISNITFALLYNDSKKELQNIADGFTDSSDWCETQLNMLKGDKTIFYMQDKLDFFDENIVFVIEGYGNYYYTYDCVQKITDGEEYSFWAYNKEAAKSNGYQKGTCY